MSGFVRLSGEFLVVDARMARFVAAGVKLLAKEHRSDLPRSVLAELESLAEEASSIADGHGVAPATGVVDRSGCIPAGWLSVNATGVRLGCSRQNVLGRLRPGGPLVGRKDERGQWWVDPTSVERFEERRSA